MTKRNGSVYEQLLARAPQREEVEVVLDEEHTATFVFQAVPGADYDAMIIAHQPTAEQRVLIGWELNWNPLTFPAAIVAASLVDPVLSEREVVQLFAAPGWSKGEAEQLVKAALRVNTRTRSAGVGKGSATTSSSPGAPATP